MGRIPDQAVTQEGTKKKGARGHLWAPFFVLPCAAAKCRSDDDFADWVCLEKCRGTELNRRHEDFQSSALPTELPRHGMASIVTAPGGGVPEAEKPEATRCLSGLKAGDGVENLVVFGESEGLEFGKNELAIHPDFKGAATALDQGGYVVEFIFDCALQTCSIGQVVSFAAVFNRDVHLGPPQQKSVAASG